ncbi:FkbM family methyltransferase [archaeon]|nr:FkbM family methyltransferase [archaeon]
MIILYITPHLSTGGAPRYLLEKIKLLNDICDVYCIEYIDITGGILVVQKSEIQKLLGNKLITIGENKHQIIEEIKRIAPDVVHFEEMPEYFCDYEVAKAIYNPDRKYKIFETSHDSSFNPENKLFFPDKFLFVSEYQRQMMQSIDVDSEVVEFPITYKNKTDRLQALKVLDLDPNLVHVINIGLFTSRKNQKELIDYARQLTGLPVQFHFIGSLADNFKSYWEEAIKDLPPNCKIWGERSDVDNFYNAADLFFFASRGFEHDKETSPLVIKECIGWNLPIFLYNLPVYCNMYNKYSNMLFLSMDKNDNLNYLSKKITELYSEKIVKNINPDCFSLSFDEKEQAFYINTIPNPNSHNKNKMHIVMKDVDSLTTFYSSKNSEFALGLSYWYIPMFNFSFSDDESFRGFIVEFYDLNYNLIFTKEMFLKNCQKHPDKIEFNLKNPFDRTFWNYQEFFIHKTLETNFPSLDLSKLTTVFDLGANNGLFIQKMLSYNVKNIHAFEPNPNALINLYDRYENNNNVKIINKAVSNKSDKLVFHYHPENSTISSFDKNHLIPHLPSKELMEIQVDTIRLDDYCNINSINNIDLLKIDVEGAEYDILENLDDAFYKKVKNVLIEFHDNHSGQLKNLIKFMREKGFIINDFSDVHKRLSEEEVYNCINGTFLGKRNSNDAILTVIVPTYNHEKYIEQCIDSLLMQKTDKEFNIIISDDCSTDRTFEIVQKYKHFKNISFHRTEKNMGSCDQRRFIDMLALCNTKYLCFLDGDDYYICENKFQKQIDFLEKNPQYVFHSPCCRYSTDHLDESRYSVLKEVTFKDNLFSNYAYSSVLYRIDLIKNNLSIFDKYIHEDIFDFYWILPLVLLNYGNGYNEQNEDPTCVYRLHDNSEFSSLDRKEKYVKVFKQTKKLIELHGVDFLDLFLNLKRDKDKITLSVNKINYEFSGFIDVYNLDTGKVILNKEFIWISKLVKEEMMDSNKDVYDIFWHSIPIPEKAKIKIDFFDKNYNLVLSRTSLYAKTALVTDIFFHDQSNLDTLIEYSNNMKQLNLPFLLMTNSKFDSSVLNYVDYLIYDKENRLFKHDYDNYSTLILYYVTDAAKYNIITPAKQKHGLSVLSNFYRSLVYLKSLNYTHIIKTEADCVIKEPSKIIDILNDMIEKDKKSLVYIHNDNGLLFTSFHIMYFEIDFLLSIFPKINNEEDYRNFIENNSFLAAEEFLTKLLIPHKDKIIIKDSQYIFTDYGKSVWNKSMTPLESEKIKDGYFAGLFKTVDVNNNLFQNRFTTAVINLSTKNKSLGIFEIKIDDKPLFTHVLEAEGLGVIKYDNFTFQHKAEITIIKNDEKTHHVIHNAQEIENFLELSK